MSREAALNSVWTELQKSRTTLRTFSENTARAHQPSAQPAIEPQQRRSSVYRSKRGCKFTCHNTLSASTRRP
jgi:hypothetical protein